MYTLLETGVLLFLGYIEASKEDLFLLLIVWLPCPISRKLSPFSFVIICKVCANNYMIDFDIKLGCICMSSDVET